MKFRGLKRSIQDFKHHPWLHGLSISTISLSLLLIGGCLLSYRNLSNLAEQSSSNVAGTVYLKEGLSTAQIDALRDKVLSLEGVTQVLFKPKEKVVQELQGFLGGSSEILSGRDVFPDVLEVELVKERRANLFQTLKLAIANFPEVVEVDFSEDWLTQLKKIQGMIEMAGAGFIIALALGCAFIVSNFMGMRHQSRKREIDIVRLMGAQKGFLMAPFLWEGLFEGLLGTTIAVVLLFFFKVFISALLSVQWISLLGIHEWLYLSFNQLCLIFSLGIFIACLGSFTVFLKFQK